MADLDERLNRLLSDQESKQRILSIAEAILAQRNSGNPDTDHPAAEAVPKSEETTGLGDLLSSLLPPSAEPENDAPKEEPSPLSPLTAMLPQLIQVLSGKENLVRSEKVNLLQAMRPYLKDSRMQSIDRALKMANAAKAATSALHLLGR